MEDVFKTLGDMINPNQNVKTAGQKNGEGDPWSGITKREFMATQILAGIMPSCRHEEEHLHYAVQAVAYADALLEALSKP